MTFCNWVLQRNRQKWCLLWQQNLSCQDDHSPVALAMLSAVPTDNELVAGAQFSQSGRIFIFVNSTLLGFDITIQDPTSTQMDKSMHTNGLQKREMVVVGRHSWFKSHPSMNDHCFRCRCACTQDSARTARTVLYSTALTRDELWSRISCPQKESGSHYWDMETQKAYFSGLYCFQQNDYGNPWSRFVRVCTGMFCTTVIFDSSRNLAVLQRCKLFVVFSQKIFNGVVLWM